MTTRILTMGLTAAATAALAGGIAAPALAADTTPTTPQQQVVTATPTAEKTVEHDFQIQETGYYCAPAATRVALSAQDHTLTQDQVADSLGTTKDGTASITQVTDALNTELGDQGGYHSVTLPDQDTDDGKTQQFKADLTGDIDRGRVVVANIVGSADDTQGDTHTFNGGHYIALVGYTDHGDTITVADSSHKADSSGDRSTTYQVPTTEVADWMATRGYTA